MKQILLIIAVALVGCGGEKEEVKACYWCKEEIKVAALVCKHCGSKEPDYSPPLITDPIVEKAIREELKKTIGELTKADLAKVTDLDLQGFRITDAGLKEVAKLQNLTRLDLEATLKITGAGLKELAKLQKLKYLDLSRHYIADASLKELAKLQKLEWLNLEDTEVTDAGVAKLRKALPKCDIRSNPKK